MNLNTRPLCPCVIDFTAIRVTLNACTNPIRVMPIVINGLNYPHSNRPFSHNIRYICHPLCPAEPFPSHSCHAFLIITKPFPRSARVRDFSVKRDFSLVTPVTTLSIPIRIFSSERSLNVRSIPLILKYSYHYSFPYFGPRFWGKKIGANKMSLVFHYQILIHII